MIEFIKHRYSHPTVWTYQLKLFGFTIFQTAWYWNGKKQFENGDFFTP
jgi:hypothetical protein